MSIPMVRPVVLASLGLVACRATPAAAPSSEPNPSAETAVVPSDATPIEVYELVLWTVPQFDPESPPGAAFQSALAAAGDDLGVSVSVMTREARGEFGMLPFLRSTARVVPSQLPDLVVLPLEQVQAAATDSIAQPFLVSELLAAHGSTFDFARQVTSQDSSPVALPFALDVVHAVARSGQLVDTWAEVLDNGDFELPLGSEGVDAAAAFLSLYASAGGDPASLAATDGAPAQPLQQTLEFMSNATDLGLWSPSQEVITPRAAWNRFLADDDGWAAVSATAFMPQQANFPGLEWGALPGASQPATPIGWGWAFAVTTIDPARRTIVEEMLLRLTAPDARDWVLAAGSIPAWPEASGDWPGAFGGNPRPSAAYLTFLRGELEAAIGVSATDAWTAALADVLSAAVTGEG